MNKEELFNSICEIITSNSTDNAAEAILALAPFEKLEKLTEVFERVSQWKVGKDGTLIQYMMEGKKELASDMLHLISKDEKPFDVYDFLLSVGFKKNSEGHFVGKNHTLIFDRHNWLNVLSNGTGLCFAGNHPKHDNRCLWINLLKWLIVIDEHEIQAR